MTTTYTVPTLFFEDHVSRDLGEGCVALITSPDKVIVSLTDEALAELISDADYYAGFDPTVNEPYIGALCESAQATLEALT